MSKPVFDIIVTHHDEPWEVGKPFFDMMQNQRLFDRDAVAITLVQDGKETALDWNKLLSGYSFKVQVLQIPHSGLAVARNVGMEHTHADWIMFCDFDDMFMDICSVRMIAELFPLTGYDVLWGASVREKRWQGKGVMQNKVDAPNFANTDCKLYRRAFLEENKIAFEPRAGLFHESVFNTLVVANTQPFRIVKITTDFYLYLKSFREDSFRIQPERMVWMAKHRFERDKLLAYIFQQRGMMNNYRKAVVTAICNAYYDIYRQDTEHPKKPSKEFLDFYKSHRHIYRAMSQIEREISRDMAETEAVSFIQDLYNTHLYEYYFANDTVSIDDWIAGLDRIIDSGAVDDVRVPQPDQIISDRIDIEPAEKKPDPVVLLDPIVIPDAPVYLSPDDYNVDKPQAEPEHEPRVAVYCGTYNTYMDMVASAKSLLYHTKMDKVYFLIEDDVFPYELPEGNIIECINVKDQKFFDHNGPNFDNSWSYMCLMRAAFPKLFPQYKKILSFDIDVVVQEDIGRLFDIDMSNHYLAGVEEPQRKKSASDPAYINFGVVIMNLEKLRRDGLDDQIIDALNRDKFGCPEQDAFNKFCAYNILILLNDYNSTVYSHITGDAEHDRIIHFAGIKFWRHFGYVKQYSIMDWPTVMKTQENLKNETL